MAGDKARFAVTFRRPTRAFEDAFVKAGLNYILSLDDVQDRQKISYPVKSVTVQCRRGSIKTTQYKSKKGSCVMIRTAIISVVASFVLFSAWTINLVSYHPATELAPLSTATVGR